MWSTWTRATGWRAPPAAVLGAGDLAADGVVEDVHPRGPGRRLQDARALGVVDRRGSPPRRRSRGARWPRWPRQALAVQRDPVGDRPQVADRHAVRLGGDVAARLAGRRREGIGEGTAVDRAQVVQLGLDHGGCRIAGRSASSRLIFVSSGRLRAVSGARAAAVPGPGPRTGSGRCRAGRAPRSRGAAGARPGGRGPSPARPAKRRGRRRVARAAPGHRGQAGRGGRRHAGDVHGLTSSGRPRPWPDGGRRVVEAAIGPSRQPSGSGLPRR